MISAFRRPCPSAGRRGLTIGFAAMLVLGCDEKPTSTSSQPWTENVQVADLDRGIHAIIVIPEVQLDGGPQRAELHLVRNGVPKEIGSFQGELRWDPDAVDLNRAEPTGAAMTFWNVVAPGHARFAGVAVDGLKGGAILELEIDVAGPMTPELFRIVMEELVAPTSFDDITAAFVSTPYVQLVGSVDGGVR